MLAYTTLGASDLEAAVEFYGALTETMGWKRIMGTDRIVFFGSSMSEACLAVCTPYDEQAPTSGNGDHGGVPWGQQRRGRRAICQGNFSGCDL